MACPLPIVTVNVNAAIGTRKTFTQSPEAMARAYELRNAARALSDNDEPRTRAPSSNIHPATPPPTMMRIAVSTPG